MELYIRDRLYILQILPQQNNFAEYCLKRNILSKVSLSKEEQEKYEIREDNENKRTVWNAKTDRQNPVTIDFSKEELNFLKKACEKASNSIASDDFWATVEKIYNLCPNEQ